VVLVVLAGALIFFLTRHRDRYSEQDVARIQSLIGSIDQSYAALDRTNVPVMQSFLAVTEHTGSRDSNIAVIDKTIRDRINLYGPIRTGLDSLEHMLRDTASAFTKGVQRYISATRHATEQIETQAAGLVVLHDSMLVNQPPMPAGAVPIPGTPNAIVPGHPLPPVYQQFTENITVLKMINEEREKAKATIAQGYH
jgi:hypothetical protein